jgi:N-methylhydantoinase A
MFVHKNTVTSFPSSSSSSIVIEIDDIYVNVWVSRNQHSVLAKSTVKRKHIPKAILAALETAAKTVGFSKLRELLRQIPIVRLCTTIGQSTLLLRKGQPIGLIVSEGLTEATNKILSTLGLSKNLLGVVPKSKEFDSGKIRKIVNRFLYYGARSIGICLQSADFNQIKEKELRDIIVRQYPPHYLGSVPVMLPSTSYQEVSDIERLEAVAVDGYVRETLVNHLQEIRSLLEQIGFIGDILVYEGDGHFSTLPQLRPWLNVLAVDYGLIHMAQSWLEQRDFTNGVALRIGSLKSETVIVYGKQVFSTPELFSKQTLGGWMSTLQRKNNRFTLVPQKTKLMQGTMDFSQRGRIPTLADVLLIIGLIDPRSLDGADFEMDISAARDALSERIGGNRDELETVALRAYYDVVDDMASMIRRKIEKKGIAISEMSFMVCGQAGGVFACAVAEKLGFQTVDIILDGRIFPISDWTESRETNISYQPEKSLLYKRESVRSVFSSFSLGWCESPVYWGPDLTIGSKLEGPALIEFAGGVCWVPPDWYCVTGYNQTTKLIRRS